MTVHEDVVRNVLRLSPEATLDIEPLGLLPASPARVAFRDSEGGPRVVLARPLIGDAGENHAAVLEALGHAGYASAPRLLGGAAGLLIEEWIEGVLALAVVPPPGSAEAAIEALAALHALPVREGLDWGREPSELVPGGEIPLHRLGFAAPEREPAREALEEACHELAKSPFGFAHRDATAAHLLLGPGRACLVSFGAAGFGPQLFDVAAFLLTSGIEAPGRAALAAHYGRCRGMGPETADITDLAGLAWGLNELLSLPRRQVEALGDDAATEALRTEATRIDRGIREPAGRHPLAAAIRRALWRIEG